MIFGYQLGNYFLDITQAGYTIFINMRVLDIEIIASAFSGSIEKFDAAVLAIKINFNSELTDVKSNFLLAAIRHFSGDVNVAGVAEAFGGGGHMNAAGCKIKGDLGAVKEALLKAIKAKMPDA